MGLSDKISNVLIAVLLAFVLWKTFVNHPETPKTTHLPAAAQHEIRETGPLLNETDQLAVHGWSRAIMRTFATDAVYPSSLWSAIRKSIRGKKVEQYEWVVGSKVVTVTLRQTHFATTAAVNVFDFETKASLNFEETAWIGLGSQTIPQITENPFNCTSFEYLFHKNDLVVTVRQLELAGQEQCRVDVSVVSPGKIKLMARSDRLLWDDEHFEILPLSADHKGFSYSQRSLGHQCSVVLTQGAAAEEVFGNDKCFGSMSHVRGRFPFKGNYVSGFAAGAVAGGQHFGLSFGGFGATGAQSAEDFFKLDRKVVKLNALAIIHDPLNLMNGMTLRSTQGAEETAHTAEVVFTPRKDFVFAWNYWLLSSERRRVYGTFSGSVTDEAGAETRFEDLAGAIEWGRLKW